MSDPIIVGAGAAGLGAATALAQDGRPVVLIDRVPVPGGAVRYDYPEVRAAATDAKRVGVTFRLGATATRWQNRRLLVCAPGEIHWHHASLLVFAGGVRPPTAAELGLVGDRPAGVLPISVAKHFLEANPRLWRNAVIVGDGPGASEAARLIVAGGGSVTYIGQRREPPEWATAARPEWRAASVVGRNHVTGIGIERDGEADLLSCDAVLLAGPPRPVRNVEGAVPDDAEDVLYLQDIPTTTFAETLRAAATQARTTSSLCLEQAA
jgi:hypothetical protein